MQSSLLKKKVKKNKMNTDGVKVIFNIKLQLLKQGKKNVKVPPFSL